MITDGSCHYPTLKIKKRPAMSVVAAIYDHDSILIGADSEQFDIVTRIRSRYMHKVQSRSDDAPLLWGITGYSIVSDRMDKFLNLYEWPPSEFNVFQDAVCDKMAELSGKLKVRIERSGKRTRPIDFGNLLIACWLDGPRIFEVTGQGMPGNVSKDEGFAAIGVGGHDAKVAEVVTRNISKMAGLAVTPLGILHIALSTAAHCTVGCGPPLHIWRVTMGGVEPVPLAEEPKV